MPFARNLAAHGAQIPAIGIGTSGLGTVRAEHIATALRAGYRHIDTARKYGTEPAVGDGMRASSVPRSDQSKVLAACRARGVVLTAYCPLARGRIQGDSVLTEIGQRHGKTAAQVTLRWLMQQDIIAAIPRSSNATRIAENIDVFDFELSEDEMRRIDALKRPGGRTANPAGRAPVWDA